MAEREALLLTLAEEHLRKLLPARLMRSISGFFTQAKVVLARRVAPSANANGWERSVLCGRPGRCCRRESRPESSKPGSGEQCAVLRSIVVA